MNISFIKDNSLDIIRKKFIGIFILNVTDIFFSFFLLSTGAFSEGNPVMGRVINNVSLSLFLKVFIPLILLIYIYIRMKKATKKQLYYSNIIINLCLAFYLLLNLSHIVWTGLYIGKQYVNLSYNI